MGHIRHNAIIVTMRTYATDYMKLVKNKATELSLSFLGPTDPVINGYETLVVYPHGSKTGWTDEKVQTEMRQEFIAYLKSLAFDDGSSMVEWVSVSYGSDDWSANIDDHQWSKPLVDN